MTATKKQLVNGVVKFIEDDLIPNVGDRNMKFVLAMAKDSLKENPSLVDGFLRSPMVASVVEEEDGCYDLTQMSAILKSVLAEYQSIPVTVPKIPLFSPVEKTIKISEEDFNSLMGYIIPAETA